MRNKLGQFIKSENNGNYIYLPSFSTIFKWSFIITILYPWYIIFSGLKDKLMTVIEIVFHSFPEKPANSTAKIPKNKGL